MACKNGNQEKLNKKAEAINVALTPSELEVITGGYGYVPPFAPVAPISCCNNYYESGMERETKACRCEE